MRRKSFQHNFRQEVELVCWLMRRRANNLLDETSYICNVPEAPPCSLYEAHRCACCCKVNTKRQSLPTLLPPERSLTVFWQAATLSCSQQELEWYWEFLRLRRSTITANLHPLYSLFVRSVQSACVCASQHRLHGEKTQEQYCLTNILIDSIGHPKNTWRGVSEPLNGECFRAQKKWNQVKMSIHKALFRPCSARVAAYLNLKIKRKFFKGDVTSKWKTSFVQFIFLATHECHS